MSPSDVVKGLPPTQQAMLARHDNLFALLGLSLGTWALGNVWRLAARVWSLSVSVNRWTDWACGIMGAVAVTLWTLGVLLEAGRGTSAFSITNILSVPLWSGLAAGGMGITSMSNYAAIENTEFSGIVWYTGVGIQLATLLGATVAAIVGVYLRWSTKRSLVVLSDFTARLYPITVGLGIATPTSRSAVKICPDMAHDLSEVLAWAACIFTALLVVPIVADLFRLLWLQGDAAQKAFPSAVIQMAPFGVAYAAYVTAKLPGSDDPTGGGTMSLIAGNLGSTAVILLFLPQLFRMPFAPTWSSLTFPTVSSANSCLVFRNVVGKSKTINRVFDILGAMYLSLASFLVVLVWVRLLIFLVCGGSDPPSSKGTKERPISPRDSVNARPINDPESPIRATSPDYGAVTLSSETQISIV